MIKRKLIDAEMEQTGEALKSPSYRARQSASDLTTQRMSMSQKNPATGSSWFETPSKDYQNYERSKLDRGLADRQTIGNQDINQERRILTELEPLANNEKNRAVSMDLKTKFPYAQYETESKLFNSAALARDVATNAGAALKYDMKQYVSL